jgi:hypothetical protein
MMIRTWRQWRQRRRMRRVGNIRSNVIEFARASVASTHDELKAWPPEDLVLACPVLDSLQDVYALEMQIRRSQIRRLDILYQLYERAGMAAMMHRLRASIGAGFAKSEKRRWICL